MKHPTMPCAGRGCALITAFALSGVFLLASFTASAQDCRGGALSPSTGNVIGSAVGGALGGLVGNQFGHGSGKGVMTGAGVVGGALAGGYVGRSMEGCGNAPQRAAASAQYRAVHHPAAAPARAASDPRTCRFFVSQGVIDGRERQLDGVACLEKDGTWKTTSGPGAEQAAEADLVLRAQQRLHDQGFYVRDNIDGRWGPATSSAVRNFQRANGLASSGRLDVATQKALGIEPAPLIAAAPGSEPLHAGAAQQAKVPGAPAGGNTVQAEPEKAKPTQ